MEQIQKKNSFGQPWFIVINLIALCFIFQWSSGRAADIETFSLSGWNMHTKNPEDSLSLPQKKQLFF